MGKLVLPIVLGVIGVVFVAGAAILGWVVMPNVIEDQIKDEVRILNGTDTWDKWQTNPVPVYFDIYVFHVTNPVDVNNKQIPVLEEVGPFVYEEVREKVEIVINSTSDTISYREKITYHYRAERSYKGQPDTVEQFCVVNSAFLILAQSIFAREPELAKLIVPLFTLVGEKLIRCDVSVRDMIFDGVPLHLLFKFIIGTLPEKDRPAEYADNRFAFYKGKNGKADEKFEVKSGISNAEEFGKIIKFNDVEKLDYWSVPTWLDVPHKEVRNSYCNMINGTDGSIFAPFVKKENRLPIFVSDICRSIYLEYNKDIEHRGIPGYKFTFPDAFFEDPVENGDNYCFCTSPDKREFTSVCTSGVIRIFPCKDGAPIVTSSPHFLHANNSFHEFVHGLKPDEERHSTYIELEPNTGMMLRIDKKLQISLEIQELPIPFYSGFNHYLFPVFWVNEHTQLDEKNADELKAKLLTPLLIVDIAKWSVIGIGAALIAAGTIVMLARR